jgi:glycosyltransferase involved in cell wall biosynthesis
VYRHYQRVSRAIYSTADRLAITSPKFADYFRDELGISPETPLYLPQYAEDIFAGSKAGWHNGFDPTKINLTFAGNVGAAQSILTLAKAAQLLGADERFSIHIVGSGSEVETLKGFLAHEGLGNVTLHRRLPIDEMPSVYASSDAMVATFQNGPLLGYTLPRKIQSYMASGKPILGAVIGEARRVIEEAGCGLCCDAEDAEGLASICRRFAALSAAEREAMGARGRSYYETHFSRETFLDTLEHELLSMRRG